MQRHIRGPNCKGARASASKSSIFPSPYETYFLQSPTKARPRIKCPKLRPHSKDQVPLAASCLLQDRKKTASDTSLDNGRGKGHVENKPDDIVSKKYHKIRKLFRLHSQFSLHDTRRPHDHIPLLRQLSGRRPFLARNGPIGRSRRCRPLEKTPVGSMSQLNRC